MASAKVNLYLPKAASEAFCKLVSTRTSGQSHSVAFRVQDQQELELFSYRDLQKSPEERAGIEPVRLSLDGALLRGEVRTFSDMTLDVCDSTGQRFMQVKPAMPAAHDLCFVVGRDVLAYSGM